MEGYFEPRLTEARFFFCVKNNIGKVTSGMPRGLIRLHGRRHRSFAQIERDAEVSYWLRNSATLSQEDRTRIAAEHIPIAERNQRLQRWLDGIALRDRERAGANRPLIQQQAGGVANLAHYDAMQRYHLPLPVALRSRIAHGNLVADVEEGPHHLSATTRMFVPDLLMPSLQPGEAHLDPEELANFLAELADLARPFSFQETMRWRARP